MRGTLNSTLKFIFSAHGILALAALSLFLGAVMIAENVNGGGYLLGIGVFIIVVYFIHMFYETSQRYR